MHRTWQHVLTSSEVWCLARLVVEGEGADRAEFRDRARSWNRLSSSAPCATPDVFATRSEATREQEHTLSADATAADAGDADPSLHSVFSLDAIIRQPRAWLAETAKSEEQRTREDLWRGEHWGTTGDVLPPVECEHSGTILSYQFVLPGGVPEAWLAATARMFPELDFALAYVLPAYWDAGLLRYRGAMLVERLAAPDIQSVFAFARRHFGLELRVNPHDGAHG